MISRSSTLPDDPTELKKIIAQLMAEKASLCDQHESLRRQYEAESELLREQIRKLFDQLFGRKSEKLFGGSPQLLLFDIPEIDPEAGPEIEDKVAVPAHSRKKPGRKPLPENLPRVEVVHDLAEEEKVCGCGAALERIGEEVSEKLDLIPAIIRVIRHIRPKYGCRCCEGVEDDGPTIKIAPVPPQIIPKGIASAGLLAHILTAKFADALPFYRQEKQFARLGVEIGRAAMCNWTMKAAQACKPLLEQLVQEIRSGPLINIDETTVQVLNEPGRSPTTKSYMWIFRGGDPQKASFVYRYAPTRSGNVAASFVKEYEGAVQTDGYVGYDFLDTRESIIHLGCWAHVRRKFMEASKAGSAKSKKSGSVDVALGYIRKLYGIEKQAKSRQLDAEQFVVGRKNWLFAGTPEGAAASAAIYSLIETAKANGLDTYQYLRYLLENLPRAQSEKDYLNLLPQQLNADMLTLPQGFSVV